jgi:actin-related protein
MFPGFIERFEKEIKAILPSTTNPRVLVPKNRNLSVWNGASILTSLSAF